MDSIINLQKKIVPELTNLLVQRYQILRQVSHEHPIGRRALAARLGLSERVLRAQVDFLKGCGLLVFSSSGMTVTEEGMDILRELADYVRKLQGLNSLEQLLCSKLNIGRVVIIPGDSDQEEVVKREIGRAAARILSRLLGDGKSILSLSAAVLQWRRLLPISAAATRKQWLCLRAAALAITWNCRPIPLQRCWRSVWAHLTASCMCRTA